MNTLMFWVKETAEAILFFILAMAWILAVLLGIFLFWQFLPVLYSIASSLFPYSTLQ